MSTFVGLDFGTTNSALAVAHPNRQVSIPIFPFLNKEVDTYRSVIYFSFLQYDRDRHPKVFTGPSAIETYLEEGGEGRLMISPKNSLANPSFETTRIQFKHYKLEEIISFLLSDLCQTATSQLGHLGKKVVAGRPVNFAGALDDEQEALAVQRLTTALQSVGFEDIVFEYEPVAAAYHYDKSLDHDELILVADFGGGTTDFCVMSVGPEARQEDSSERILGTGGVGIAGDVFDSRIVHNKFSYHLGRDTQFRSQFGEVLPMPNWLYSRLNQWYTIGLLRNKKTLSMLNDIRQNSYDPEKIEDLIHFIELELGFYLYRSTEQTKVSLSSELETTFVFDELDRPISEFVERGDFEDWIHPDLAAIDYCLEDLLNRIGLHPEDIDKVFMTGGTSLVPAVRHIFESKFGSEKVDEGDTFTSVAQGLALRALDVFG